MVKIVSYYTRGTPYEQEAASLREACLRVGADYNIEPLDSLGRWDRNCCLKPLFLLEQLRRWKQPILWVDSDAMILQKPQLALQCDLAVHIDPDLPWGHLAKVNTGTIYIAPTKNAEALIEEWHACCERCLNDPDFPEVWDQMCLQLLLPRKGVEPLPMGYCGVFDCERDLALPEIFILQTQASRAYKKIINGTLTSSLVDGLTIEERRQMRRW